MSDNITPIKSITKDDINPDIILNNNIGLLEGVVFAGITKDGEEVFASSYADAKEILWLIEKFKLKLMELEK